MKDETDTKSNENDEAAETFLKRNNNKPLNTGELQAIFGIDGELNFSFGTAHSYGKGLFMHSANAISGMSGGLIFIVPPDKKKFKWKCIGIHVGGLCGVNIGHCFETDMCNAFNSSFKGNYNKLSKLMNGYNNKDISNKTAVNDAINTDLNNAIIPSQLNANNIILKKFNTISTNN